MFKYQVCCNYAFAHLTLDSQAALCGQYYYAHIKVWETDTQLRDLNKAINGFGKWQSGDVN